MNCSARDFIRVTVGSCRKAETGLKAAQDGVFTFSFDWLGYTHEYRVTVTAGSDLSIDGTWFNEESTVIGYWVDSEGARVSDAENVDEILVTVRPVIVQDVPPVSASVLSNNTQGNE